jgi:SSS family solute:Na+ symporter
MLSTSLSKDLYKAFLDPDANDRRLLAVGRWTSVGAGVLGVLLAIVLPSVVDALKTFYSILTAALFVPLLAGLLSSRPGPGHARAALALALVAMGAGHLAWRGTPLEAWAPSVAAIVASFAAFAPALLRRSQAAVS